MGGVGIEEKIRQPLESRGGDPLEAVKADTLGAGSGPGFTIYNKPSVTLNRSYLVLAFSLFQHGNISTLEAQQTDVQRKLPPTSSPPVLFDLSVKALLTTQPCIFTNRRLVYIDSRQPKHFRAFLHRRHLTRGLGAIRSFPGKMYHEISGEPKENPHRTLLAQSRIQLLETTGSD